MPRKTQPNNTASTLHPVTRLRAETDFAVLAPGGNDEEVVYISHDGRGRIFVLGEPERIVSISTRAERIRAGAWFRRSQKRESDRARKKRKRELERWARKRQRGF
jgi:hypothetical protein